MTIALRTAKAFRANPALREFAQAVLDGLSATPKTLPCRFFYDARGSQLFEEITRLPEYYPTRTEAGILEHGAAELLADISHGATLVEFGSGSSTKTEMLLRTGHFIAYVPIDVSSSALAEAAERLERIFPLLDIRPLVADFTQSLALPFSRGGSELVGFFPGSTIGNFTPEDSRALLAHMADMLGRGAKLVIGVDLKKDPERLVAAYDDAAGVTAEFNLNLLVRINRDLDARIDVDSFAHRAVWNERHSRIEMHLVSLRDQTIEVAGEAFDLRENESIHTENSCKYTVDGFQALAREAGWASRRVLSDEDGLFAVILLEAL